MGHRDWTEDERYAVLRLYFELEFGQFHSKNKRVIALADVLNRSANSIAMKLGNFAGLDPTLDRKGLSNFSKADRALMAKFDQQPDRVVDEMERVSDRLGLDDLLGFDDLPVSGALPIANPASLIERSAGDKAAIKPQGMNDHSGGFDFSARPTQAIRTQKVRLNQRFFRRVVMSGYHFKCCLCQLGLSSLLEAAHIKAYNEDESCRLRPDNGLALCRNHHAAFDAGYWTLDHQLRVEIDPRISRLAEKDVTVERLFMPYAGQAIHQPFRYLPAVEWIEWHRENRFGVQVPVFGGKYGV